MSEAIIQTPFAETYAERRQRLSAQMREATGGTIRLGKETSNLFRDRTSESVRNLSVGDFNHLLKVNDADHSLVTEGMITYGDLVGATLPYGYIPAVVPQLRSITIGGAFAGVGIESTCFRHGLTHQCVNGFDVLLPDGSVVYCERHGEYQDLFYGFPNSYGTFGYALSMNVMALPVKPFVKIEHVKFTVAEQLFTAVESFRQQDDVDFLDGSVFSLDDMYLTVGRFVDEALFTSDYTYKNIYYRSIKDGEVDYLTTHDYLWRWDTDWFWCSKNLYVQNPLMRRIVGRKRLNSVSYTKVMRWNSKWGVTRRLNKIAGYHTESVIQDIDIPIENASEFLRFLYHEIGVLPIWICPIRTDAEADRYSLFPMRPNATYINFGFWDSTKTRELKPPGYLNRKIEKKTGELGGIKSLYSDVYYDEEEFWSIYNESEYRRLKQKYDPAGKLLDLYDKCVLNR